jgi:agmatine deiminase
LLISHQQLSDTYNTTTPYAVVARLEHRSGIQTATLYYRTDTIMQWQSVPMTNTAAFYWTGMIPPQAAGTTVYYYFEGESVSGKTQKRPMPAPAGYFHFNVLLNAGIQESNKFEVKNAFPNPSHGLTCIPVTTGNCHLTITLKNILGQSIEQIYDGPSNGERKYFVNTADLSQGVYIIESSTAYDFHSQKLIVR